MPTVFLSPIGNGFNFLNGVGSLPNSGGKINTYLAGTTTPQVTYTTSAGSITNANPIVLNAAGTPVDSGNIVEIWLVTGIAYKFVLTDALNNTIATYDNLSGINDLNASAVAFIQAGAGAITRTAQNKMREWVSVLDFGALGNGATDDTTAFQNAINRGGVVIVPVPTASYVVGNLSFTVAGTRLIGAGAGSPITPTATLPAAQYFNVLANDVEIAFLKFNVNATTYAANWILNAESIARFNFHDIVMNQGAGQGVRTNNCTDGVCDNISITTTGRGIEHKGASSARITTTRCYVSGSSIDHCISVTGADHKVESNYVTGANIFGIEFASVGGICALNKCFNTTREGINVTDTSDCLISGNKLLWSGSVSQDFGISAAAQAASLNQIKIIGNTIAGCGKAGIALAPSGAFTITLCDISDNTIINPNQLGVSGPAITLQGATNTSGILVQGNYIFDGSGHLTYGVDDTNSAGSNRIINNSVQGAANGAVNKLVSSVEALNSGYKSFTTTVTSGTGTITTLGTVTFQYYESEKKVDFVANITITTNGTAATNIQATLPFANNATLAAVATGRENALTGNALQGYIAASSSSVVIVTTANAYPGGTGAVIWVTGSYIRV